MIASDKRATVIEPFDAVRHDRTGFSSGTLQVDNFFQKTIGKLSRADNIRVFVLVSNRSVVGFYALNAHAVQYEDLPQSFAKSRPRHGSIPAAYIAMIGVDHRHQRQGFGGDLLVDCLRRIASVAENLGLAIVVLDVLDCGDATKTAMRKRLYESYGFVAMPTHPLRLFLPVRTVSVLMDRFG